MVHKGYNLLGLAQRAGKIQSGDAAVEAILKKGKAKMVLMAKDASEGTKRHFLKLAQLKKVPCLESGEKLGFGAALGKSPRSVIVIMDEGFADRLYQLFDGEE